MVHAFPKFPRTRGRSLVISFWKNFVLTLWYLWCQVLSTTEKSLLSRGFNFAIPPKYTNYVSDMFPFELLHRNVDSLKVSNLDKEFIESRLRDCAFPSYKSTGKNLEKNVPILELDALKILVKSKDIVAQKLF